MTLLKNTKNGLKERLAKVVEGLSKQDALEFLDRYKDSIKQRNAIKSHPTPLKKITSNVLLKTRNKLCIVDNCKRPGTNISIFGWRYCSRHWQDKWRKRRKGAW